MSVAKLFSPGRQFDANVFVNSLTFSPMTTAERNALVPSEGLAVVDTTLDKFLVYLNGDWRAVDTAPVAGKPFVLWTLAASVNVPPSVAPVTIPINLCNTVTPNNALVRTTRGGLTASAAGIVTVPAAGVWKIEGTIVMQVSPPPNRLDAGAVALFIGNQDGSVRYAEVSQTGFATPNTVSLNTWTMSISSYITLAANAQVGMYFTNYATAKTITVITGAGANPLTTWFTIEFVSD